MLNYNGYFIAFLWYNKSILLETTILRMYVEGDKGTGRFITSLGVYVCLCNIPISIWYYLPGKDQSNTNNQSSLFNSSGY